MHTRRKSANYIHTVVTFVLHSTHATGMHVAVIVVGQLYYHYTIVIAITIIEGLRTRVALIQKLNVWESSRRKEKNLDATLPSCFQKVSVLL